MDIKTILDNLSFTPRQGFRSYELEDSYLRLSDYGRKVIKPQSIIYPRRVSKTTMRSIINRFFYRSFEVGLYFQGTHKTFLFTACFGKIFVFQDGKTIPLALLMRTKENSENPQDFKLWVNLPFMSKYKEFSRVYKIMSNLKRDWELQGLKLATDLEINSLFEPLEIPTFKSIGEMRKFESLIKKQLEEEVS